MKFLVCSKRGFTLIEIVVVIAIIAIAASITVPNLTGYLERAKAKEYIQQAKTAKDTIIAMASLQYAETSTGNPYVGSPVGSPDNVWGASWGTNYSIDETVYGNQYIYADSHPYAFGTGTIPYVRFTLANLAAPDAGRSSAGITEFKRRTLLETPHNPWSGGNACEKQICYELYVNQIDANIEGNGSAFMQFPDDRYFNAENIAFGRFYFPDVDKTDDRTVSGAMVTYGIESSGAPLNDKTWRVYTWSGTGWEPLG